MTKEEALKELAEAKEQDPEAAHSHADYVIIEYLRSLGENEVADAWDEIQPKWYA